MGNQENQGPRAREPRRSTPISWKNLGPFSLPQTNDSTLPSDFPIKASNHQPTSPLTKCLGRLTNEKKEDTGKTSGLPKAQRRFSSPSSSSCTVWPVAARSPTIGPVARRAPGFWAKRRAEALSKDSPTAKAVFLVRSGREPKRFKNGAR